MEPRLVLSTANQQFVEQAYLDLLGRHADANGLAYWTAKLDGGASRASVTEQFTQSNEYYVHAVIAPDYQKFLGRDPDAAGQKYWVGQMRQGLNDEQLAAELATSQEFYNHAGGNDAAWMTALYRSLLGRAPDAAGEANALAMLKAGGSRLTVALDFANSHEAETQHIKLDYQALLGRSPGSTEVGYWLTQHADGLSQEGIVAQFAASGEYFARATHLQSQPLALVVDQPTSGEIVASNVTVSGDVVGPPDQIASLDEAIDSAAPTKLPYDNAGRFQFATSLPIDGTADGNHTLHVQVTNLSGKVTTQDVGFILDTQPPVISVQSPAPGQTVSGNFTVDGKVSDATSRVASLTATVDSGAPMAVNFDSSGNFKFTTALATDGTADGSHTIHLRSIDRAGNVATFDLPFTLSTGGPTLAVTQPTAGELVSANVKFTGTVTPKTGSVVSLSEATDSSAAANVAFDASGNFSFTTALATDGTADGQHSVHLRATDSAGKASTLDVNFTLDTQPPVIKTQGLTAGQTVHGNVRITGTVTDAKSGVAQLTEAVDAGSPTPLIVDSSGNFSLTTALATDGTADGSHTIHLRATDRAGNLATFDLPFTLDTAAPVFQLTSPASGEVANTNIAISGTVTDRAASINSLTQAIDTAAPAAVTLGAGGAFNFNTSLALDGSADGQHIVHLRATDSAGATTTLDVRFTLDTQPPVISVQSPTSGETVLHNVTVTGQATDATSGVASLTAAVDSGAAAKLSIDSSGNFSFNTTLALDGSANGLHTVHLQATDKAGNAAKTDVTFTLQAQPGVLALTLAAPLDASQVSSMARLGGSAGTGATGATYSLDGGAATPLTLDATGGFDQAISAAGLTPGKHTVVVQANGSNGATMQSTANFTVSSAFVVGPTGSNGWAMQTPTSLHLAEQGSFVVEATAPVQLGTSNGSRTISFSVGPHWDTADQSTVSSDRLLVYLVDPNNPTHTLLDSGVAGAPLFTLIKGQPAQYLAGRVRFDGSLVQIDATSLKTPASGLLKFQLIGGDSDSASTVDIANITDSTDPNGQASPVFNAEPVIFQNAGPALDPSTLTAADKVAVLLNQVHLDATSGVYSANLSLQNNGPDQGRNIDVVFRNLPAGVQLANPSGTDSHGSPYFNLHDAIPPGGLATSSTSDSIQLTFNDPSLARFALAPQVLVGAPDPGPVVSPINGGAPLAVTVGQSLVVKLQASDADGDPIQWSLATQGTLPTGNLAADGTLTFNPTPSEVGSYSFSVIASDGVKQVTMPLTLNVTGAAQATTEISGVVEDSNGAALAGVPVNLGNVQAMTAADGSYSLQYTGALPSTLLEVDGGALSGAATYPSFSENLSSVLSHDVYAGYNNVITRPTYLTAIDTAHAVTVDPTKDTLVTSPLIPGASLLLKAGSVYDENGLLYSGPVSITRVAVNRTPAALPADLHPDAAYMIEPAGLRLTTAPTFTMPNTAGYGTVWGGLSLYGSDPVSHSFRYAAFVPASPDGKTASSGSLPGMPIAPPEEAKKPTSNNSNNEKKQAPAAPIIAVLPKYNDTNPKPGAPKPANDDCGCQDCQGEASAPAQMPSATKATPPPGQGNNPLPGGGPLEQAPQPPPALLPLYPPAGATTRGDLHRQQSLGGYISQGTSHLLTLNYSSLRADPRPVVSFAASNPNTGDANDLLTASLSVHVGNFQFQAPGYAGGQYGLTGGEHFFSAPSYGSTAEVGLQADMSSLPSGVYSYTITKGIRTLAGSTLAGFTSQVNNQMIVVNSSNSTFGSGWDLSGWEQVAPDADGSALVIDGDGTRLLFGAPTTPGGPYTHPMGEYSTLVRLPNGNFQRTLTDGTVYAFNQNNQVATISDRNGNVTRYQYDSAQHLTAIVDPTGLTTTLSYVGGKVSAITDPAGRVTSLNYDNQGNLVSVTLPDGSVQRYQYGAGHELTGSTDANGHQSTNIYDVAGRVTKMSAADGSSTLIDPIDVHGLVPANLTVDPASPQPAPADNPVQVTTADANGNVTAEPLTEMAQVAGARDDHGTISETDRDARNLVTRTVDALGNVTLYSYDAHGNLIRQLDELSDPSIVHGSIAHAEDQYNYTFQGVVGERLYFQALNGPTGATATLTSPSGDSVFSTDAGGGNRLYTLLESGKYTLTISGPQTGSFAFQLTDAGNSTALQLNTPINSTLDPKFGADVYQITGTKGELLNFQQLSDSFIATYSSPGPSWTLYGVDDQPLTGFNLDSDVTLPADGVYVLVVGLPPGDTQHGDYGFEVSQATTTTSALSLDTPTTATIGAPGDISSFTFTGHAGQQLVLDLLGGAASALTAQLVGPGIHGLNNTETLSRDRVVVLTASGTFTLNLTGVVPGAYSFILHDAAKAATLPLSTVVTGCLDSSTGDELYQFSGTAGQHLYFNSISLVSTGSVQTDLSSAATWQLFGPHGEVESESSGPGESFSDPFSANLPLTGTYVLVIHHTGAGGPVDYTFQADDITPPPVATSGLGVTHSGTLAAGRTAKFTFTGSAGLPVFVDDLAADERTFQAVSIALEGPNGFEVQSFEDNRHDPGLFILPDSGTYTVTVTNNGSTSAPYSFRALDLSSAPLATLGQTVSGSLAGYQTDVYRVTAAAGEHFLYDGLATSPDQVKAYLFTGVTSGESGAQYERFFTAPAAGTYYLAIASAQATTANYSFRLIDSATATPLTLNTPTSGTLSPPPAAALYQFAGTAGQLVSPQITPSGAAIATIYNSQGDFGASSSNSSPMTLGTSGEYFVTVDNSAPGNTPINYSLDLVAPTIAAPQSLTIGQATTANFGTNGGVDSYTITGSVGDLVDLATLNDSANSASAVLIDPLGNTMTSLAAAGGLYSLSVPGTYTLKISSPQSDTYQFRLLDSSTAAALTPNSPVSGSFISSGDRAIYQFRGTAGEQLTQNSSTASAIIVDAYGTTQSGPLPGDANYVVVVSPSTATFPAAWTFELNTPSTQSTPSTSPYTLGTAVSGTLAGASAQTQYTFTATAGQRLFYEDLGSDSGILRRLTTPDGQQVGSFSLSGTASYPFTLTETGNYVLNVTTSAANQKYDFALVDVTKAASLSLATATSGTLTPGNSIVLYTYTGKAGQRLHFQMNSATSSAWQAVLYSPVNQSLNSNTSQFDALLPLAGVYVLAIEGTSATSPLSYNFTVTDVSDSPVTPSGFGTLESGTLASGASKKFTFAAPAGLPVYFDNQVGFASTLGVELDDPNGQAVFSQSGYGDQGPLVLTTSGTYTLKLTGPSSGSEPYQFRLLDLNTDALPLTLGQPASGTLNANEATDVYSFAGKAGQRVLFNPTNLASVFLTLDQPNGTGINLSHDAPSVVTLPFDGVYYLTATTPQSGFTPYSFIAQDVATLPTLTDGLTITGAADPTTDASYRFAGTAGQQIFLANQTGNSTYYTLNLLGVDGRPLNPTDLSASDAGFVVTLPATGEYVLLPFTPQFNSPNAYSFLVSLPKTTTVAATVGNALLGSQRFTYDPVFNKPTSYTDELGHQTLYQLDPTNGNVFSVTHVVGAGGAANIVTSYTYNSAGQVISMTDPLGHVTEYDRNAQGQITKITEAKGTPDEATREYTYDSGGNLSSVTDENGHVTQYVYDAANRLVQTTDPLGNVSKNVYDGNGNLVETIDALGRNTHYAYDSLNRRISTTDAAGGVTQDRYDTSGNVIAVIDPLGRETDYRYDSRSRLTDTIDPAGGDTQSVYDANGNVIATIDANGHRTSSAYDARNRLVSQTDALGNTTAYAYDAADNKVSTTDANGHASTSTFDELNRLVTKTDAAGGLTTNSYNAAGNLVATTDPLGHTTQFAYDARDRVIKTTDALGGTTTISYDSAGNELSISDALGHTTSMQYDADNRLVKTTDAAGGTTTNTYDAVGNLTSETDQLGHATRYAYDALDRKISTTDALNATTTITYDAVGNRLSATEALGRTTHYAYDALDRLIATTDAAGGKWTTSYDAVGNQLSMTDALGRTTTYTYDADNRMASTTNALGGVSSFQYDPVGNKLSETDALGRTTTYAYDALDRQVSSTDALGGVTTNTYDANGNLTSLTDALGRTTRYTYDALDRLTTTTDALGGVTAQAYDVDGNIISTTGALGHTTKYAYDALNRPTTTTDALAGVQTTTFDAAGNVVSQTDPLNRTTKYAYDADNRLLSTTDPLGNVSSTAYDAAGQTSSTTDPLGRTTQYTYDALGRVVTTTDPAGGVVTDAYDAVGNLLSDTDPLGRTTHYADDGLDRRVSATDPLGNVTTRSFDAVGNLLSTTDPLGNTTHYAYDALDRLLTTTDPSGGVTTAAYDAVGNQTSLTDPAGNKTTDTYDALNRLTSDTNALGAARTYQYDAAGNLISQTDRDGRTTHFGYDALNRQTQETWLGSSGNAVDTFTNSYDAAGQLAAASDANSSYQFGYDAPGRMTTSSNSGTPGVPSVGMNYSYDAVGNLLSRADTIAGQASGATSYQYDKLDRPTQVTQSGNGIADKRANFTYDAASELTGITRYSDVAGTQLVAASSYAFDGDGRLTTLTHAHGGTTLAGYKWTFDKAGRITASTSPDDNATYTYDSKNQLVSATHTGQTNESYSYDANGNRTGGSYKIGKDNQLLSDGTYNYVYDAEGNRIERTNIATGQQTDYTWDYRDRLTSVVTKDSKGNVLTETDYTYDVFNNRISQTVTDHTTATPTTAVRHFVYDGSKLALTFDGSGALTDRYLYAPATDHVLADERPGGQVLWALNDDQGTVRDVISSTGQVLDHISYDAFGQRTSETIVALDFLFGYAGMQYDASTGDNYDQARFYDPVAGQFLSQDPIGFNSGDTNLYRYVGNSPMDLVDPSGFQGACFKLKAEKDKITEEAWRKEIQDNENYRRNELKQVPTGSPIDHNPPPAVPPKPPVDDTGTTGNNNGGGYGPLLNNLNSLAKQVVAAGEGAGQGAMDVPGDVVKGLLGLPGQVASAVQYAGDVATGIAAQMYGDITGDKRAKEIADNVLKNKVLPPAAQADQAVTQTQQAVRDIPANYNRDKEGFVKRAAETIIRTVGAAAITRKVPVGEGAAAAANALQGSNDLADLLKQLKQSNLSQINASHLDRAIADFTQTNGRFPNNDEIKAIGRGTNCVNCAYSYAAQKEGGAASALPSDLSHIGSPLDLARYPGSQMFPVRPGNAQQAQRFIESLLTSPNSHGVVAVQRPPGGGSSLLQKIMNANVMGPGHAFNVEMTPMGPQYVDAQSGQIFTPTAAAQTLFKDISGFGFHQIR